MTRPPTLADLAADPGELIASCQNCHHNAVMPLDPVLVRYGLTTLFPEVRGRFRCSACGSRQVDVRPNWSRHSPGQITRHTDHPARRDRWLDDGQEKGGCPAPLDHVHGSHPRRRRT